MEWTHAGLLAAIASAVLLLLAPLGARAAVWSYGPAFILLGLSALLALAGIALASAGAFRSGGWGAAVPAAATGFVVIGILARFAWGARGTPPIHDISTDTDDPPAFVALVALRAGAANPHEYAGPDAAAHQRRAYPDVQPLLLPLPPGQAFDRALTAGRALGWEIVAADAGNGRIEAVDTTFWFRFRDDVVIRVRGASAGSRVDARSKSRVGIGDAGANARRVRALLDALRGGDARPGVYDDQPSTDRQGQ